MFGLDFNDLRDCAWMACFWRAGANIDEGREQYAKTKRSSHKRVYLKWQVTALIEMNRCYDALRQKTATA